MLFIPGTGHTDLHLLIGASITLSTSSVNFHRAAFIESFIKFKVKHDLVPKLLLCGLLLEHILL